MATEIVVDQSLEREKWLVARRGRKGYAIGASETATAAGFGGYCTPYHLIEYIQQLERVHPWEGNSNTERGHRMEPKIIDLYSDLTGYKVSQGNLWIPKPSKNPNFQAGDEHRFVASLDGQVHPDPTGAAEWSLEIKCIGHPVYTISPEHMAQMQQQLAISGFPFSDFFAAWYNGDESKLLGIFYKRVYFSEDYWRWIYPRIKRFSLVLSGEAELTKEMYSIQRELLQLAPKVRVEDGLQLLLDDDFFS